MIHNSPSGVLSSCDLLTNINDDYKTSMVKEEQLDSQQYHLLNNYHPHPRQQSDSSRSSSICSSSLSPKTLSPTTANSSASTTAVVTTHITNATVNDIDPQLAQHIEYELGLTKKNGNSTGTRKNAWGNLSYAELISKAITSSAEQRLTLSEIYDWMIKYVPFFRNKVDKISSAGWKNSIRHNLSLHSRFKRIQSEGTGKSSWWIINPDEKESSGNGTSTSSGPKQPRRRLGSATKSSSPMSKRPRTSRATKTNRLLTDNQRLDSQHQTSLSQQIQSSDVSITPVYDSQSWSSQLEIENTTNNLYEPEVYSPTVHTPPISSNGNSTGCITSNYPYDDVSANYVGNTPNNNTNNTGDYSYHHPHHFHHPSHPLYQHHHGHNYDNSSTGGYYHQQPVLNEHCSNPCSLPIDTYHTNNPVVYSLQQQQIDPNDEQIYLHVQSASSHSSSSSSLSPPILTANNLLPSVSSISSSSGYTHLHKLSSSHGYRHPTSNGTITLYGHHHRHHSHPNNPEMESLLHSNVADEGIDDDDDFSTLVHHHHGSIDDQQQLSYFFPNTNHNHQLHSHNDSSTSLLRTVLKRPMVGIDMYDQQV